MDELAKEGVKAVVAVTLRPLVKIIEDGVGYLGGDALAEGRRQREERRHQRRVQLGNDTINLLKTRGVKHVAEPTETSVEEILSAAQDENREELRRIWAALLAAAIEPARAKFFRQEFIDIAKKLEPVDALVLPLLFDKSQMDPVRAVFIGLRLEKPTDEIEVSFRNLRRLDLTTTEQQAAHDPKSHPQTSALGRQFLAALRN